MVTRRVTQRLFLLQPSKNKKVACAFRYCLALAAEKTGVKIHLVAVMSNHYHIIVTDEHGLLPYFVECLNKNLARCLNALHGRSENFWAGGTGPSYVRLVTREAVLDKCAYTLTNPVKAGLVKSRRAWPGELLEKPGRYKAEKPTWFFRSKADGGPPDDIKLTLTPPPVADSKAESIELVEQAANARETSIRAAFKTEGRKFMGAAAVLRQRIEDTPASVSARRGLSPTVASRDKWRRIEALQIETSFKDDYERALRSWIGGNREAVFPVGTYKMRIIHKVRIAEA